MTENSILSQSRNTKKVCRKVFQEKRKAFNSAAFRKAEDNNGGITQYVPPPSKKQPQKQQSIKG